MRLEQQICSLELSKRLKELGVKQLSIFWWCHDDGSLDWLIEPADKDCGISLEGYSAFTVAELGEIIIALGHSTFPAYWPNRGLWEWYEANADKWVVQADTEADARAKMLIYLVENHLVPELLAEPEH